MLKKSAVIFMSLILSVCCLTACSNNSSKDSSSQVSIISGTSSEKTESNNGDQSGTQSSAESSSVSSDEMFSDSDTKDVTSESVNAEIKLSGNEGTISDTTRGTSGSEVTITSKGIYKVTGSSENVSIVINDTTESGNIYLILDSVSMTNTKAPCINVKSCDKLIIQCTGSSSLTYNNSDSSAKEDGAVYAKDDVTINGSGSLNINSSLHAIVCKKDLKITGSTLTTEASSIGIKAGNSLRIGGGTINITSAHDGIKLENDDNDSYFYFEKADMTVTSGYDGISVKASDDNKEFSGYVTLNSGKLKITTASGSGSSSSKNSSTSQKGIKTDGNITVAGTELEISSADDAIHGNAGITINSGTLELSSSDDGITASGDLTINGGTVNVTKSYEGIEGANITINDGTVSIKSSDDGINTSGGSDSTQSNDDKWNTSDNSKLTINGGKVYVNADGDGLDSNGSIYITGGTVIVEGPTSNNNGAIDKGDGSGATASITGGTVLALGSSGMAVNFDSGTQCSALVDLSGTSGTEISVDDGSGFTYTATKDFQCVVYSSPSLSQGNSYTIKAGNSTATMDFTSSLYYSNVSTMGGGMGGPGGVMNR